MVRLAKRKNPPTQNRFEDEEDEEDSQEGASMLHAKHSKSSLGSQVEVEGGVALTEEAVVHGDPDVMTQD